MSCQGIVKFLLFFVNSIFTLVGIAIFGGGIYVTVVITKMNGGFTNLNTEGVISSYIGPLIMIIGLVVFFVSFCACFGAIKEINCLLVFYSIVMFLLLAFKIGCAVYLFISKAPALNSLQEAIDNFSINGVPKEFHVVEFMGKCCGTTGPGSYRAIFATIPVTCCPVTSDDHEVCNENRKDIYWNGCKDVIESALAKFIDLICYSLIGIALFELVSMLSAMYLICYSKKSGAYYEYD